jgi:PKHD-type hydroxylase
MSKQFLANERNNVNHFNYYYYSNAFTPEELEVIKTTGNSYPKQLAEVGGGEDSQVSDYRKSEISWIPEEPNNQWLYDKISQYAISANKEMWNFDIWGYHDTLQFTNYYGDGGHYDWHADLGPGISNRKLSVVLQLSDPKDYVGGELQMNTGGGITSVPKEYGLLCFFPSFVLHRVTPLTSGTRTSLVTWLCGANLR